MHSSGVWRAYILFLYSGRRGIRQRLQEMMGLIVDTLRHMLTNEAASGICFSVL